MRAFTWIASDGSGWQVRRLPIFGLTEADTAEITIRDTLRGKTELETYIHEGIHAELPKAKEDCVEAMAESLADLLWRAGYRRKRE